MNRFAPDFSKMTSHGLIWILKVNFGVTSTLQNLTFKVAHCFTAFYVVWMRDTHIYNNFIPPQSLGGERQPKARWQLKQLLKHL